MSLQPPRGTHDLLPDAQRRHRLLIEAARQAAERFGFHEMATPIFECIEVFKRTLGETSDVVHKEMYVFTDRSGEQLVLRPEGTAPIARAFISEGLAHQLPVKFFYQGPMFRYERPQKGRQRQFHQFGVELLGVASPLADIECIQLAQKTLEAIGVAQSARLEINTLGDQASRSAYREALVTYLERFKQDLSEDSQRRLSTNPLRILDSKDPKEQKLLEGAPKLEQSLTPEAREFFARVQEGLNMTGVKFTLNPRLVRGFDYYSHVVFEFRTNLLGAQDAILSGGRYDSLVGQMGGPETPGVGWAAGIERLAMLMPEPAALPRPIAMVPMDASTEIYAMGLAQDLRAAGWRVEMTYSGNVSKRMKKATQMNAKYAIIVGEQEMRSSSVALKDLDQGRQDTVARDRLLEFLQGRQPTP